VNLVLPQGGEVRSVIAAVIPPRQPPMMFTSGEPETSRATSIASIVACA